MYFADCVRVSIIVIYLKVKGSFIIDGFGVADSEGGWGGGKERLTKEGTKNVKLH